MAKPTQADVEAAVRTLIEWAGDDPDREGLIETPARVARSYRELFAGYESDPREYLQRTFTEVGGYDELVVLKDIRGPSRRSAHARRIPQPRARRIGVAANSATLALALSRFRRAGCRDRGRSKRPP